MNQRTATIIWFCLNSYLLVFVCPSRADDVEWDGGGTSSEWLDPDNWENDRRPGIDDKAIIINDTATITGVPVPTVGSLEVGVGSAPGGLSLNGAGNTAMLEVLNEIEIGPRGELEVGAFSAHLLGSEFHNQGDVTVSTGGQITTFQQYVQQNGNTILSGGSIIAPTMWINDGELTGFGQIDGDVSLGNATRNASLSPGIGIGDLAIHGDLELGPNAEFHVQIDASGGNVRADLLQIDGQVSLGGTLNLSLLGGAIPAGEKLSVLIAESVEPGTFFDDILGLEVGDDSLVVYFDPGGLTADTTLDISYSSKKGDMNFDDVVNEFDARMFALAIRDSHAYIQEYFDSDPPPVSCFSESGAVVTGSQCGIVGPSMADMDSDQARTFADIPLFLDAVDASGGSPVAALTEILSVLEVPEPATVHFLALIAISAGIWHRQPFRLRSPASTWG